MTPRFLAELKKGMLWEPRVIESGRETVEGFKEDERGKRRASVLLSFSLNWFSVIHVFMSSVHALSSSVRLVTSRRGADFRSCGSSAKKLMIYRVVSYDIREEWSAQDKKNGPQHWTLKHTIHGWDGDENELLLKWTDICLRDMTETIGVQQTKCQKQSSGGRGEFGGQ